MKKGIKICGISDPKTLNYILNHPNPPNFVGFITNYTKSKRFVEYEKLRELLNVNKRDIKFISILYVISFWNVFAGTSKTILTINISRVYGIRNNRFGQHQ